MTTLAYVLLVSVTGLIFLWLYVAAFTSWQVARSDYFDSGQRRAQYAIIWFVPLIGAAVVLHVLSPDIRLRKPGWVPWLDAILLSTFASSVTMASDETFAAAVDEGSSSAGVDND